jgi:signal transduction histidine kinase
VLRGEEQEFERQIPDPKGGPPRHSQAHYIPDFKDGQVRGFSVLVADVTRRKVAEEAVVRMERQLQASERLAAMATLAAGIAHEINNPLASVSANLQLAVEACEHPAATLASIRGVLSEAIQGVGRVSEIVRTMHLLARGDTTERELVDINAAFERSIDFAANAVRYRARLVRQLGPPLHFQGNGALLAQVLVNLLVNAAQALPESTPERNEICVRTRVEHGLAVLEVADNGSGIPEALRTRIFEPFFTTKGPGAGMGLGLSVSRGIVEGFGGSITLESEVGKGSTFRVTLPLAAAPAARLPAVRPTTAPALPGEGLRSLLVIDDEVPLTTVFHRALSNDFAVTVANSGRTALDLLAARAQPFDLILCDLMMPEVSGQDVYTEAVRARPELAPRFVFITGGAFTARGKQFLASTGAPVLQKPFDLRTLRKVLKERLA